MMNTLFNLKLIDKGKDQIERYLKSRSQEYKDLIKKDKLDEWEGDALRHTWLVDFLGTGTSPKFGGLLADARESNQVFSPNTWWGELLSSGNEPMDIWNHGVAVKFLEDGGTIPEASSYIKDVKKMRNPQYPFVTWN
jgi:hypothetical protein